VKVSHSVCGAHKDSDNFWPSKTFRLETAYLNVSREKSFLTECSDINVDT